MSGGNGCLVADEDIETKNYEFGMKGGLWIRYKYCYTQILVPPLVDNLGRGQALTRGTSTCTTSTMAAPAQFTEYIDNHADRFIQRLAKAVAIPRFVHLTCHWHIQTIYTPTYILALVNYILRFNTIVLIII